jgi:hypothetical protein
MLRRPLDCVLALELFATCDVHYAGSRGVVRPPSLSKLVHSSSELWPTNRPGERATRPIGT